MAPWRQHRRSTAVSPSTLCTLAFPASFFFFFPSSPPLFVPSLSLAANHPCDLGQRVVTQVHSVAAACCASRNNRSATSPRRVPSQQATLRRRVTAGGHFQYGDTRTAAYGMRKEARPPSFPSTTQATRSQRFVRCHVITGRRTGCVLIGRHGDVCRASLKCELK